jgi:hypothetical protein
MRRTISKEPLEQASSRPGWLEGEERKEEGSEMREEEGGMRDEE